MSYRRPQQNSGYQQLTIPEMLSGSAGARSSRNDTARNMRFSESMPSYSSEHALAPSTPLSRPPDQHDAFYPTMRSAYEAPSYHHPSTSHYEVDLDTPQYHSSHSYYDTSNFARPPRCEPSQKQPYYGVPGFYNPYEEHQAPPRHQPEPQSHGLYETSSYRSPALPAPIPRRSYNSAFSPAESPYSTQARKRPAETITRPEQEGNNKVQRRAYKPEPQAQPISPSDDQPRFTMEVKGSSGVKDAQDKSPKKSQRKRFEDPADLLRTFSGTVQRVLKWDGLRELFPVLLEVIAPLKNMRHLGTYVELLLRDETGPVLQVQFYEIDRALPPGLVVGQLVRAVGRPLAKTRMQAYSLRPATEMERAGLQRISFVCHNAAMTLKREHQRKKQQPVTSEEPSTTAAKA